jgi:hypothetical protein
MNQKEFSKKGDHGKDDFVIALSMELRDPDNLVQEMRLFKEIVFEWHRARRENAAEVKFIALSDSLYHQAIEEFTEACHSNDIHLKPIFEATKLHLSLHDFSGKLIRERTFEKGKESSNILGRWFGREK